MNGFISPLSSNQAVAVAAAVTVGVSTAARFQRAGSGLVSSAAAGVASAVAVWLMENYTKSSGVSANESKKPQTRAGSDPLGAKNQVITDEAIDHVDADSVPSAESSFTGRPGVDSPGDTLSLSLVEPLKGSTPETRKTVFKYLMSFAVKNDFNLHVYMTADALIGLEKHFESTLGLQRDVNLSSENIVVLNKPGNKGTITFEVQGQKPVDWTKDLIFHGPNSSHVRTERFLQPPESPVDDVINDRRYEAWQSLGIQFDDRESFLHLSAFIGHSGHGWGSGLGERFLVSTSKNRTQLWIIKNFLKYLKLDKN